MKQKMPYQLSMSIGSEKALCKTFSEYENLMIVSDEKMYKDKKKYKEVKRK